MSNTLTWMLVGTLSAETLYIVIANKQQFNFTWIGVFGLVLGYIRGTYDMDVISFIRQIKN